MSGPRFGISLDDRELVGVRLDGAQRVERIAVGASGAGLASTDDLTDAFAALRARLEASEDVAAGERPGLAVALLAPLVQFRRIELPPLPDDEVEGVLRRDAARYFPGGAHRRVVATSPRAGGEGHVRAVAASAQFLEALVEAAEAADFRVHGITAGWHALAAGLADAGGRIAVARGGQFQAISVEQGVPTELRRAPLDASGAWRRLVDASGVTLVGDGSDLEPVRNALTDAGVEVRTPAAGSGAAALAARHAVTAPLRLIPDRLREARTERDRRRGARLLGAAAVLVVVAVGVHWIGLRQDLERVRAERAAIAEEVAPLLAMRDSLTALNEDVRAVREVSSRSYDWATGISELALLLPRETYLTSLYGTEGDLEFEAAGERAGAAIDALRAARSLGNVRLEGLVERELEDGETVVERFRLGARVRLRDLAGGGR
jgi:hypothetical protein